MDRNWGSVFDSLETILQAHNKGEETKRDNQVHVVEPVKNITLLDDAIYLSNPADETRQDPDASNLSSSKKFHFSQNPKYLKILAKRKYGAIYHFYDRSLEEVREIRANRLFEFIEKETNRRKTHLRHVIMEKSMVLQRREELKREKQSIIEQRHQKALARKSRHDQSQGEEKSLAGAKVPSKKSNDSDSKSNNAIRSLLQEDKLDTDIVSGSLEHATFDFKISEQIKDPHMPVIDETITADNTFSNGNGDRLLNWKTFNSFHQKYLYMDTSQLEKPRYHGISDGSGKRKLKERVRTNNFGTGKTSENIRAIRQMLTKNARNKMQTMSIYNRLIVGEVDSSLSKNDTPSIVQLNNNGKNNIGTGRASDDSGALKRDGTISKSSNVFIPSNSTINIRRSPNDISGSTRSNLDMNRSPSYQGQGSGMLKSDSNFGMNRINSQISQVSGLGLPERRQTSSSISVNHASPMTSLNRQQTVTQPLQVPTGKRMSFASSGPTSSSFGSNINSNPSNNQLASTSSVAAGAPLTNPSILNRQNSFQTDAIKEFIERQNQSIVPPGDIQSMVKGMVQRQTTLSSLKRQGTLVVPKGAEFGMKGSGSILARQSTLTAVSKPNDLAFSGNSSDEEQVEDGDDKLSRKTSFGGRQGGFMIRRMTSTVKTALTPEMSSVIKQHRDLFDPSLTQDDDESGFKISSEEPDPNNMTASPKPLVFLADQQASLSLSSESNEPVLDSTPFDKKDDYEKSASTKTNSFIRDDTITPERWKYLAAPLTHYAVSETGRVLYPSVKASKKEGVNEKFHEYGKSHEEDYEKGKNEDVIKHTTRILRSLNVTIRSNGSETVPLDLSTTVPVFYSTVRFFPTGMHGLQAEDSDKIKNEQHQNQQQSSGFQVGRKTPKIDYDNILDTARNISSTRSTKPVDDEKVIEARDPQHLRLIQTMSILDEFPPALDAE